MLQGREEKKKRRELSEVYSELKKKKKKVQVALMQTFFKETFFSFQLSLSLGVFVW